VDEWVRAGLRHAVIAPGSRSTPVAVALAEREELELHVVHDERAASFVALGIGLETGLPAILLCTSGTAAAHFHAAVIEAHQADVPMIVCTADRPPELRDVGAAQTVDQLRLYGPAVRWFHDPGVPSTDASPSWRAMAARAVAESTGRRPGPVHLNLPFREPLVGTAGALPAARPGARWVTEYPATPAVEPADLDGLVRRLDRQRGVIVAGGGAGVPAASDAIHRLAGQLGWPVLADPRSGCRVPNSTTVGAFDALLRHSEFATAHSPEVVLRFGGPPASKVMEQWIERSGADEIQIWTDSTWRDPAHRMAARIAVDPARLCAALDGQLVGASRTPWLARWRRAEARAQAALTSILDSEPGLSEPAVARTVVAAVPDGGRLVVSSSMPIRDVEWYGAPRTGLSVVANRGANGIDGVVATGIGVALASAAPTTVLIGDVAFLHDSSALVALARRRCRPALVVVDNDGGGIFSFLPQASALSAARFELLFGTPHGTDLAALSAAHRLPFHQPETPGGLSELVRARAAGVIRVVTDRAANVAIHDRIHRAVQDALGR
jgi:2-succinyl-5-enolpyruvyl-6-hydroxy-3-cyclohexene-1-carboxylate synthase